MASSSTTLDVLQHFDGSKSTIAPEWPQLAILVAITTVTAIILKIAITTIGQRYENHKIFDRGNIPSVGNKNPFSGNLFQVLVPKNNMEIMLEHHKRLGKNYGIFYGPDPWILSTDLDLLQRIFMDESHKHVDIQQMRMPIIGGLDKSIGQVGGNEWRRIRRALNPSFSHKQMKLDNVYQDIEDVCKNLLQCIDGHQVNIDEKTGERFRVIDSVSNFTKFALEIVFKVALGRENAVNMKPDSRDELIHLTHEAVEQFWTQPIYFSIMFTWTQKFLGLFVRFTKFGQVMRYVFAVLEDCLSKRRQQRALASGNLKPDQRRMIDTIMEQTRSNQIDEESLKANLFFIFTAGFDTPANALAIMFWLFARHPEVQEKLRKVIITEGEGATYLEWVIKETLRLYTPVPAAVGRIVSEDIKTSQGQTIFKGTSVLASIDIIHHSEEYWGKDVWDFRPERFGEPLVHPLAFFAFAHGPRQCLGKSLAYAQMRAIVSRILLRYRIEPCPTTPETIDINQRNLIHIIINGRIDLKFTELNSI